MGESAPLLFADARAQLSAELGWLDRLLEAHVRRIRATGEFTQDPFRGAFIEDSQVDAALRGPDDCDAETIAEDLRAAMDGRERASLASGVALPLAALCAAFDLGRLERAALVMGAAPSIERRFGLLFGYANNDASRRGPTVDLVLRLMLRKPDERITALARFLPGAPLADAELIRWAPGHGDLPLAERLFTVPDDALAWLTGGEATPAGVSPAPRETPEWEGLEADCADILRCCGRRPVLALARGAIDDGSAGAISGVMRRLGRRALLARLDDPVLRGLTAEALAGLLLRAALPRGAALLVDPGRGATEERLASVLSRLARAGLALFALPGEATIAPAAFPPQVDVRLIDVPPPDLARRRAWWRAHRIDAEAEILARRFRHGPEAIEALLREARAPGFDGALAAARRRARLAMPALAQRVAAEHSWRDLVLPAPVKAQLADIVAGLAVAAAVEEDWGLKKPAGARSGQLALFAGASGAGKTMAAGIVAGLAGLDLYRVELSAIFDKYIGETEKHIDRLFHAAEAAGAALLFDEAEVLFGKRTEAQDSHDRYANLSVAYLLQRIETFPGLTILATNMGHALDPAFARRILHAVTFPPPDAGLRLALWRQFLPESLPRGERLALEDIAQRFEMTGGAIRTAAYAAACRAAAEGRGLLRRDLLRAIAREFEKLGRPASALDFGADVEGLFDAGDGFEDDPP